MSSFRIDFKFPSDLVKIGSIKMYPDIIQSKIKILCYETFAELSIIMGNKVLLPPWVKINEGVDYSSTEYLWDFFYMLLREASNINDGQEHKVEFVDDPLILSFQKIGSSVTLSFNTTTDVIEKIVISYQEFLEEIINKSEKFIHTLVQINPKLNDSTLVKNLLLEKEKVEELYHTNIP